MVFNFVFTDKPEMTDSIYKATPTGRGSRSVHSRQSFVHAGFQDYFVNLTLYRDCNIKSPGLKKAEYGAEPKTHIELAILLLCIVTAESLWK